jgi:gluconolactonase
MVDLVTEPGLVPIASGLDHPEGLAWSDTHGLFAGGESGQIYRIDIGDGSIEEVARTGGFALGMAFGPDGTLMVCDNGRKAVVSVDVASGSVTDWSAEWGIELTTPNHLAYLGDGTLFNSDSGTWGASDGRILRVQPSGSHQVVARSGAFTNGLAVDPSETQLYAVESSKSSVCRFEIAGEDLLPGNDVWQQSNTVPDGLAFTDHNTLLISCYRPDAVFAVESDGTTHTLVHDWTGLTLSAPTNIAFVGDHREWLVVANLAGYHLTRIDAPYRGHTLPFTS